VQLEDRDVWLTARLMIKRYGDDAGIECAMRRDQLIAEGDGLGAAIWKRVAAGVQFLTVGEPSGAIH
jgi:hypothetical protein